MSVTWYCTLAILRTLHHQIFKKYNMFIDLTILTSYSHWPDAILIESEAFVQRVSSHGLIEHVTAGEVERATIVLVNGNQANIDATECWRGRGLITRALNNADALVKHRGNEFNILFLIQHLIFPIFLCIPTMG